ncbi:hypothetical protein ABZX65_26880 [Streptomyces sp. NPDC003300]|uniref:hypothetical protein n=1 Tax=unclassified Streptomyces TaxID=2593676 RepID=UPI0033B78E79
MRSVYCCVICGVHYLPPEGMVYPESGVVASPAHCASPVCTKAARDGEAGLPLAMLETLALKAAEEQQAVDRRVRRGRGRRAGAAPGGGRSKLR